MKSCHVLRNDDKGKIILHTLGINACFPEQFSSCFVGSMDEKPAGREG